MVRSDSPPIYATCVAILIFALLPAAQGRTKLRPAPITKYDLPASIFMGSLELQRCPQMPAYCGTLSRPLDPAGQVPGVINISFELFPHRDHLLPPLDPIVANEGGPGYPSSGTASSYVGLFYPLMDRHDLLLVDQRGTGNSQAIDCEPLQNSAYLSLRGVGLCGEHLGNTSDLYGSGIAADDMAAVLDALGFGRINLYGDSYGTYFAQTFAGRHPGRLRALVLDSAYPVVGLSPWYPEASPAMRNAFDSICRQSLSCRNLPRDSISRIEALLNELRIHPFRGTAHDGNGQPREVTANPMSLALLAFGNSTGPVVYRETDAAARAYLDDKNSAPLLRLLAENSVVSQSGAPPFDPIAYSAGLFVAVSCSDYPQIYDMKAPPWIRVLQRDVAFAAEQERHPEVYAPFTINEFNSIPLDFSVLDTCIPWPIPSPAHPPGQPVPAETVFTSAPVLVLSGTLDSLTPAKQGAEAAKLFQNAQQVLVANSFHVTALDEQDDCASVLVRRFVIDLDPGDTSCASRIAEVRTVPRFATIVGELPAARPLAGNQGTVADLQLAAAAALTAGDAIARWWMNQTGSGVGLYGGTFQYAYSNGLYQYTLVDYRWVKDVAVSGSMTWTYSTPGAVIADLSVVTHGSDSSKLVISWNDRQRHAMATISGVIDGRNIAATMYAP